MRSTIHARPIHPKLGRGSARRTPLAMLFLLALGLAVSMPATAGLYISPIPGLTSEWHPAPRATSIPLGTTIQLKLPLPPGHEAVWRGVSQVTRQADASVATFELDTLGRRLVEVDHVFPNGSLVEHGCEFTVEAVAIDAIQVPAVRASVDPLLIDPDDPAGSAYDAFWQHSVATLGATDDGRYLTSIHRRVRFSAEVVPPGFAPLVEWRGVGGDFAPRLGGEIELSFQRPGLHRLAVGPPERPTAIQVQTYRTVITSHEPGRDLVPDGVPITFTARTEPAGFEDRVTWVASTLHGSADPVTATGREMTVRFQGTFGDISGEGRQWLGVRADDGAFEQDRKAQPRWNRSVEGLTVVPSTLDPLGEMQATAFFSISAENLVEPVDLSTEVIFLVNGDDVARQTFDIVAQPPSQQFGCNCPPGFVCVILDGVSIGCVSNWLICDPVSLPLQPDDRLDFVVRPLDGADPDEETRDDQAGALFDGGPLLSVAASCPGSISATSAAESVCGTASPIPPMGSIEGQWNGRFTGTVNVGLTMNILGGGADHVGTWRFLNNGDVQNQGLLTAVVDGSDVTIVLLNDDNSPETELVGSLNPLRTEIQGTIDGDRGAFQVRLRQTLTPP